MRIKLQQPPYNALRARYQKAARHLARAAAEIEKATEALAGDPDWEELCDLAAAVNSLSKGARNKADEISRDCRPGRSAMLMFATIVSVFGRVFTRATGRKPVVTWNASKGCYQGAFLVLINAILPWLSQILDDSGFPLAQPVFTEPAASSSSGLSPVRTKPPDPNTRFCPF